MKIRIDNKDNPAEKRCFVDAEQLEIAAFPDLDHFEIARMELGGALAIAITNFG